MKRFIPLILTALLAISAFAATSINASEATTAQYCERYGITLLGEEARVENEIIQIVVNTKSKLPRNLKAKFQQYAPAYTLSPAELIDLTLVGTTDAEKDSFFVELSGEKATVTYHGNGIIIVDEDPAAIKYE